MTPKILRQGVAVAALAAFVSVGTAHAADEFFIADPPEEHRHQRL